MKSVIKVEKCTDDVKIGWFDEETDEWSDFEEMTDEEFNAFCNRSDFRKLLINALRDFCTEIRGKIGLDLDSIWKRLDAIEKK